MTSDAQRVFVWAFLPGDATPTLCGRLTIAPAAAGHQVATFVYGRTYLANPAALPLDPFRLPLQERAFEAAGTSGGEPDVFGVIADALPDSWGRYVIDRRYGSQPFPTGYLLLASDDAVGNLCFSEDPSTPPAIAAPISRDMIDVAWGVIAGLEAGQPVPTELLEKVRPNTAMGGARPKLTIGDERAQWIAKFPSAKDDRRFSQARVEAAMLDLAELCGITAAEAEVHVARAPDGSPLGDVLLVKRFDRSAGPNGWLRDAFVSARTVAYSEPGIRATQFMASYTQFAEQLQRWSARPAQDRHELFRRLVFNCCISNTDDHDRNYGLVAHEEGHLYRLSPAYDMVPRVHGTKIRMQAMNFGSEGSAATVENLLSAASSFGLSTAAADETIRSIQETVAGNWLACVLGRGMTEEQAQVIAQCFETLPERRPELGRQFSSAPRPR